MKRIWVTRVGQEGKSGSLFGGIFLGLLFMLGIFSPLAIQAMEYQCILQRIDTAGKTDRVPQIVKGTVLAENNFPLPGATVRCKGTKHITAANLNGYFEFEVDLPQGTKPTLAISFIGMETKEVEYKGEEVVVKLHDKYGLGEIEDDDVDIKSFDPVYFILGTLSDYMGRFRYIARTGQVDSYYPHEKPLAAYLNRYIKTALNIEVNIVFKESNHGSTYSDELAEILNSFYGKDDKLINDKFETEKQIYSFLAGVCLRYAVNIDPSTYEISLANSPKHDNCFLLLKQIGCEKIFYTFKRTIPAQFIICFEPTRGLKGYLKTVEAMKVELRNSSRES